MTLPKRFYTEVRVADGQLLLDGKSVKTKSGQLLAHPSAALMQAIAEEWAARDTVINYHEMPLTRLLMATLELSPPQRSLLQENILNYAGTDLLCYHSAEDTVLAARQHATWLPWVEWLAKTQGVALHSTSGIMPVQQSAEALSRLRNIVEKRTDAQVVALNELTGLLGSVVLAWAVLEGALPAGAAFDLSVLDELYQLERWGEDAQATVARTRKKGETEAVGQFILIIKD